jgi:hypothetical protein
MMNRDGFYVSVRNLNWELRCYTGFRDKYNYYSMSYEIYPQEVFVFNLDEPTTTACGGLRLVS